MPTPSSRRIPLAAATLLLVLTSGACQDDPIGTGDPDVVEIGALLEISGTLPEVGESSRRAAVLFLEERAADGVDVGGETVELELIVRDNATDVDVATDGVEALIEDDGVLVVLGPNTSTLAIAAGAVAEAASTPLISPWSTNPATTAGRDFVFRAPFIDSYQGPVLAEFATAEYGATTACTLFEHDEAYSVGIAESFAEAWEAMHGDGSVLAEESFPHHDTDIEEQLVAIRDAGCDVVFAPLYADDVVHAVPHAADVGIEAPILGSDSWVTAGLIDECGDACEGVFFSAHYIAEGATGVAADFIDLYEARWGDTPDDVAALTWDAMQVIVQGLENCGDLTGDLAADRQCLRDGIAAVDGLEGVTGTIGYDGSGDPAKCVIIGQISEGALRAVDEFCPGG